MYSNIIVDFVSLQKSIHFFKLSFYQMIRGCVWGDKGWRWCGMWEGREWGGLRWVGVVVRG
jgi:hypothetical protein